MTIKALGGMIMLLLTLVLAACCGDDATTVTTTVGEAGGGPAESASEEIVPPDATAQKDIDEITDGVKEQQQASGASASDTAVGGEGGVPVLTFKAASSGLEDARYCSKYVIAGPSTSCAFALNVAYDYFRLNRASRFVSYSPVTGKYYAVRCKYIHPTLCRAGNGAVIAIA